MERFDRRKRQSLTLLIFAALLALMTTPVWGQSSNNIHNGDTAVEGKFCAGADVGSGADCSIVSSSPTGRFTTDSGDTQVLIEEQSSTQAQRELLKLSNNGNPGIIFENTGTGGKTWVIHSTPFGTSDDFAITKAGTGVKELTLKGNGDLEIQGTYYANGGSNSWPDYVFEEGYDLMPLSNLKAFIEQNGHLPKTPTRSDIERQGGIYNTTELQLRLLEKVEELTLYTLQQRELIDQQQALIRSLQARVGGTETSTN